MKGKLIHHLHEIPGNPPLVLPPADHCTWPLSQEGLHSQLKSPGALFKPCVLSFVLPGKCK